MLCNNFAGGTHICTRSAILVVPVEYVYAIGAVHSHKLFPCTFLRQPSLDQSFDARFIVLRPGDLRLQPNITKPMVGSLDGLELPYTY